MLGILFAQVWHWASWTKKERPFIKIIVVSHYSVRQNYMYAREDTHALVVCTIHIPWLVYLCDDMAIPSLCHRVWQVLAVCGRQM
jgi:hypothetical protein